MKHFFQLDSYDGERLVIIEYYTTHCITKELEDKYNVACADKMKAQGDLDDALTTLLADGGGTITMVTAHRNAAERYERACKHVEDLDNTPVPLAIKNDSIKITIAALKGETFSNGAWDVRCQLHHQDLFKINQELELLKQRVAATTSLFHQTFDF